MQETPESDIRIITQKELCIKIPYSSVQIWRLEKAGAFPRRVSLGPNRVGWVEAEVEAWLRKRMDDRGTS